MGLAFPRSRGARRGGGRRGPGGKKLQNRSPRPPGVRDHRQRDAEPPRFIFGAFVVSNLTAPRGGGPAWIL